MLSPFFVTLPRPLPPFPTASPPSHVPNPRRSEFSPRPLFEELPLPIPLSPAQGQAPDVLPPNKLSHFRQVRLFRPPHKNQHLNFSQPQLIAVALWTFLPPPFPFFPHPYGSSSPLDLFLIETGFFNPIVRNTSARRLLQLGKLYFWFPPILDPFLFSPFGTPP